MVVSLVLKQQQPGLALAIHGHIDLHRAGIDLLALVQLVQLTGCTQVLHCDGGKVHEADGLVGTSQGFSGGHVLLPGVLQQLILKHSPIDNGSEGSVPAMVGPVGVDHPDLGDGGISVLGAEIVLAEGNIVQIHGQAVLLDKSRQAVLIQPNKAVQGCHLGGNVILHRQSLRLCQRCLPAFHRVDHILLDLGDLSIGQLAVQGIDLGGADSGPIAGAEDLDALGRRVCPLVKLTGQGLHRKHDRAFQICFGGGDVHLGLGKNRAHRIVKQLLGNILRIVAIQHTHLLQILDAQQIPGIMEQALGFAGQRLFLFHKNTINHSVSPYRYASSAFLPMSLRR